MEENGKLEDIRESTVDGLVKRLIEVKYIKPSEEAMFKDSLKQSIYALDDNEKIPEFMLALSAEIREAPTEIFTSTGINMAYLKEVLNTVTKTIEINSEKMNEPILEESNTIKNEKTEAELQAEKEAEIEKAQNEYRDFLGLDLSKKEAYELVKAEDKVRNLAERFKKNREEHPELSDQECLEKSCKDEGTDINDPIFVIATGKILIEDVGKKTQESGSSSTEVLKDEIKKNPLYKIILERYGMIDDFEAFIALFQKKSKELLIEARLKADNKTSLEIDDNESKVDNKLKYKSFELAVRFSEKNKAKIKKLEETSSDVEKEFFENFANLYLASGKTMSEIYDELSETSKLNGLTFYEVLKGVGECFEENLGEKYSTLHIDNLIEAEMKNRAFMMLKQKIGQDVDVKKQKMISRNEKGVKHELDLLKNFKEYLKQARNVTEQSLEWLPKQDKSAEGKGSKDTEIDKLTSEKALKNRNAIMRDRNEIKKIVTTENISYGQAIKKYFETNPQALEHYSEYQRKLLVQDNSNMTNDRQSIISVYNEMCISYNSVASNLLQKEVDKLSRELDLYKDDGTVIPKLLAKKQIKLERLKEKIKKISKSTELLKGDGKKGSTISIIAKEDEKNKEIAIFKSFVESGKSATEIYRELEAAGDEHITFESVIDAIKNQSTRFIKMNELNKIIGQERKIYELELTVRAYEQKLAIVQEKKNNVEIADCKKNIILLNSRIENYKRSSNKDKRGCLNRVGLEYLEYLPNSIIHTSEIESKSDDLAEKKAISTADTKGNQNPYLQVGEDIRKTIENLNPRRESRAQIASSEIEVADIKNNDGMIPNIEAIAKKGKVTLKKVKESLDKIFKMRKDSDKAKDTTKQSKESNKSGQVLQDNHADEEILQ